MSDSTVFGTLVLSCAAMPAIPPCNATPLFTSFCISPQPTTHGSAKPTTSNPPYSISCPHHRQSQRGKDIHFAESLSNYRKPRNLSLGQAPEREGRKSAQWSIFFLPPDFSNSYR